MVVIVVVFFLGGGGGGGCGNKPIYFRGTLEQVLGGPHFFIYLGEIPLLVFLNYNLLLVLFVGLSMELLL